MKKEVNFSYKKAIYPHLQRKYQDQTWWVEKTRKNAQKETAEKSPPDHRSAITSQGWSAPPMFVSERSFHGFRNSECRKKTRWSLVQTSVKSHSFYCDPGAPPQRSWSSTHHNMEVSIMWAPNSWMVGKMDHPNIKWMTTGGTPISGNRHIGIMISMEVSKIGSSYRYV